MSGMSRVLNAKINTYLGSMCIVSFGLFVLTIGFDLSHMVNPIEWALAVQTASMN